MSVFPSLSFIKARGLLAGGIFAASLFAALFIGASYLLISGSGLGIPPAAGSVPQEEVYDNFKIEGFSVTEREAGRVLFALSADRVVHRKRVSELFVYQNMKEICFTALRIDIHPRTAEAMPFEDIAESLLYLGKQPTTAEEYMEGLAGDDLDFLTRVLAEGITISVHGVSGPETTISAGKARIGMELQNMVFEDGVSVVQESKRILAPVAVWSIKHRGLLFPEGYSSGGVSREGAAFFAFGGGALRRLDEVPGIDYSDPLEEKEKVFYAALKRQLPRQVRFFLGITK